jgi:adenylosuccinate lyase
MVIERYTTPEMAAIWTARAKVDAWLRVELAVCDAWAARGAIPAEALPVLHKASINLDRMQALEAETDHDMIAFLRAVGETVGDAARYLHIGLTSSDIVDTGLALQARDACDQVLRRMTDLDLALMEQALHYKDTPMMGRTHGVHAEPITFGLKLAGWLAELRRQRARLQAARAEIATGKISGAVGTHANVPPDLEEAVCARLELAVDPVSTQIVGRDRHAFLLEVLALLATAIDRWATEIRHLARTEVREVEEPFGRQQQGSSAMPHKRNPHKSERLSGLARVVRGYALAGLENVPLWHERDISHSSAERLILPGAFTLVDYMLFSLTNIIRNLDVYPARMRRNLEASGGLVFSQQVLLALVERGLDRQEAYKLVQRAALAVTRADAAGEPGPSFVERLAADPEVTAHLSPDELAGLLDLGYHLKHIDVAFRRLGIEA